MTSILGDYNPLFYAQEALMQLHNALGMVNRVHRGFDAERSIFGKGDTISIKSPTVFTVQDAPGTAEDLAVGTTTMVLDKHKTVKFALTDREQAYTGRQIIDEHIAPASMAIADYIDADLNSLALDIPWSVDFGAAADVPAIVDLRTLMFNNKVPVREIAKMHLELDGTAYGDLNKIEAFSQYQGAGATGVAAQTTGLLAPKYGFNPFENQNVLQHTAGTISDTALTASTAAAGVNVLTLSAAEAGSSATLVPGDSFVVAGNTQRYAVTNTTTVAGNAFTGVTFVPALAAATSGNPVVTVLADSHKANLAFHSNAFAIAFAKLPDLKSFEGLGAQVASIQDPITGLTIRARIYYVGNSSEIHVALDILYGIKTLDPNLACRGLGA